MPPSINIASFQNCGTERYTCIDNKRLTAFIDVMQEDSRYTATLQYGMNLSWIISTCYTSNTKKGAVLMAFDEIVNTIDIELLDDVCCPDVLRPYKLQKKCRKEGDCKKRRTSSVEANI